MVVGRDMSQALDISQSTTTEGGPSHPHPNRPDRTLTLTLTMTLTLAMTRTLTMTVCTKGVLLTTSEYTVLLRRAPGGAASGPSFVLRDASGTVLPGRVRTVWEKPAMCSPCFGGPRKDIEFTDDAPARLRADVVAMVVAKAALDAVTPESG